MLCTVYVLIILLSSSALADVKLPQFTNSSDASGPGKSDTFILKESKIHPIGVWLHSLQYRTLCLLLVVNLLKM